MTLTDYDTGGFHDEMFDTTGRPRPEAQLLLDTIGALGDGQLERCQQAAERMQALIIDILAAVAIPYR